MCKYAIVDLEMCRVPRNARKGKYCWGNETIQIGAVLLNEDLEIIDEFATYVAPEYGQIDNYINNLTKISRNDIATAPNMENALKLFVNWLPSDAKVVSWSNNDEVQIRHEIESKEIVIEGLDEILDNWIDCQKTFTEKMHNDKCYKLSEALIAADIMYEDGAHNGLIDAYNTALLFSKMQKQEEIVLNPYYQKAVSDEQESTGFTMGNLFKGLDLKGLTSV